MCVRIRFLLRTRSRYISVHSYVPKPTDYRVTTRRALRIALVSSTHAITFTNTYHGISKHCQLKEIGIQALIDASLPLRFKNYPHYFKWFRVDFLILNLTFCVGSNPEIKNKPISVILHLKPKISNQTTQLRNSNVQK